MVTTRQDAKILEQLIQERKLNDYAFWQFQHYVRQKGCIRRIGFWRDGLVADSWERPVNHFEFMLGPNKDEIRCIVNQYGAPFPVREIKIIDFDKRMPFHVEMGGDRYYINPEDWPKVEKIPKDEETYWLDKSYSELETKQQ